MNTYEILLFKTYLNSINDNGKFCYVGELINHFIQIDLINFCENNNSQEYTNITLNRIHDFDNKVIVREQIDKLCSELQLIAGLSLAPLIYKYINGIITFV